MSAYNLLLGMGVVPVLRGEGIALSRIENLTADERQQAISIALEQRESLLTELQAATGLTSLDGALKSLLPVGRMECLATMTDVEIDAYAGRFGVSGQALIEAIFSPEWNRWYMEQVGAQK